MPPDYPQLLADFSTHLTLRGLSITPSTAADGLACFVSSQMLLLAGPSGTGKSSLARGLADFFSAEVAVIDAEPGLIRPQDLVGYSSSLTGTEEFVGTAATEELLSLHDTAGDDPPVLIVEEANLSPIEGYLAPLSHGLSGLSARTVRWPLHASAVELPLRGKASVFSPPQLVLDPYPRMLGTLNVDASAPAPANKIAARGAVVLLEPPRLNVVVNLPPPGAHPPSAGSAPPGRGTVGNPTDPLLSRVTAGTDGPLREALRQAVYDALGDARRVSPRMAQRALMFQAAYEALCQSAGGSLEQHRARHAAENALLHVLLPVLSPTDFTEAARRLVSASQPNGLLHERLATLRLDEADWRHAPDDFWSGLS